MSGRGGRGGGSQTVRAVANALGIARHEMHSFQPKQIVEPPPLYPVVKRNVLPLEANAEELQYMTDLKQEILDSFTSSEFFLDKELKTDVQRYIDKYSKVDRARFRPDFSRLPDEICWIKEKSGESRAKRKKLDEAEVLKEKLQRLEENETGEVENEEDDGEAGSETSEKSERSEPEGAVSEDEGEEDNDYISTYFDNGEGYGDAGSDDNMDGDEY